MYINALIYERPFEQFTSSMLVKGMMTWIFFTINIHPCPRTLGFTGMNVLISSEPDVLPINNIHRVMRMKDEVEIPGSSPGDRSIRIEGWVFQDRDLRWLKWVKRTEGQIGTRARSHKYLWRGGERGRRDCRRDYPVSLRRVRSGGFRGERPRRNDWRNSHEWRDCQARRDFRYPESRRGSGGRSHTQSATMNCGWQQPAAQGGVSSRSSRGCRSARAPSPSTRRSCTLPASEEIGSLGRKEGRKATRLPSPPSRRTVTLTSGTDGAIGRTDNMETDSTGCRVNAEETRTVGVEGTSSVRKTRMTPKVGKKECPICRQTVTTMKRHVEAKHLPWYFSPDLACWQCRFAEETTMKLWGKHGTCTNGLFDNERLRSWFATMWGWIGLAARFLEVGDATALVEKVRSERWYPKESGFQFSPTRRELFRTAQKLQTSLDVEVSAQPPNCAAALLTWQTALQILCYLPEDAREWFKDYPLREPEDGIVVMPLMMAVDSHCHLETVQQWFHLPTPTSVLQLENVGEHPNVSLQMVIWNRVFPGSWRDDDQSPEEGSCRIVQTFGAHPRLACTQVPWERLQMKMAQPWCHGIGECGLDATATDMDAQKSLFQLHLLQNW